MTDHRSIDPSSALAKFARAATWAGFVMLHVLP